MCLPNVTAVSYPHVVPNVTAVSYPHVVPYVTAVSYPHIVPYVTAVSYPPVLLLIGRCPDEDILHNFDCYIKTTIESRFTAYLVSNRVLL